MRTFTQSEKIQVVTELLTDLDNLRGKAYRWFNHNLDEDEKEKVSNMYRSFEDHLCDARGDISATISEYLAISAEKFAAQAKEGRP